MEVTQPVARESKGLSCKSRESKVVAGEVSGRPVDVVKTEQSGERETAD